MTASAALNMPPSIARAAVPTARTVVHRTRGHRHGPITRLMSPSDLGELVKPFIFLDLFQTEDARGGGFPPHPHSGIATHTTLLEGASRYGDSTGKSGHMPAGSVEWMQAGGGVWHWGSPEPGAAVLGYQLWVALPASLEHAPPVSAYLDPTSVPSASLGARDGGPEDGRLRVLLGAYGSLRSPIDYGESLTYLHVRLRDGARFTFDPGADHDVAWLAVHRGKLHVANAVLAHEMAVFSEGNASLQIVAEGDAELVIGSARKHPHPLVCGDYSVHTSKAALERGEAEIERVGALPAVSEARRGR